MSDEQPDAVWAPIEPKPSNHKRVWLIVSLIIAALAIVGLLLFLFLPRAASPKPGTSESSSPSASPSASPTASVAPTATPATEAPATEPPVQTEAPPAVDPTIEAFRGRVSLWLEDAGRGLDMAAGISGPDAVSVVETLQLDAQRLADAQPPSSIAAAWRDDVTAYAQALEELRSALAAGPASAAAMDSARTTLADLTGLVGL